MQFAATPLATVNIRRKEAGHCRRRTRQCIDLTVVPGGSANVAATRLELVVT